MTSNTDKLRAVFLTALMIGSVFAAGVAFTGSAAADVTTAGTPGDVDALSDTSQTITGISVNTTNNVVVDISNLTNAGVDITGLAASTTDDGASTSINTVDDSAGTVSVAVTGTGTFNLTISNFSATDASNEEGITYTLTQDNTVQTGAFAITNADQTSFNDGGIVFQGQTLTYDSETDTSTGSYTLYERMDSSTGSPVRELNTDSDDLVNVTTSGLSTGTTYFVSNDGQSPSNADINFTIREQNFDVTLGSDEVPNDDTGVDVDFVSTNRQNTDYTVYVTSENLDDSELVNIFDNNAGFSAADADVDGDDSTDDDDGIALTVPSGGDETATANFSGIDAGSYTFDFDVSDTTASDSGSLNVTDAAEADSSFNNIDRVSRGDVSTVNVSLTSSSYATVQIGSEGVGYEANITVEDGNSDGYAVFDVNTYTMGNNTNVDATQHAFTGVGDDTVTAVNITTENLSEPIASGNYRTTVRTGEETADQTPDDVSRLSITDDAGVTAQNIWTAPGEEVDIGNVIADGTLSQDTSIAQGDYVVHEVEANGIFGVLASDTSSDNSTAESLAAVINSENFSLTVEQTDATTQLNRQPKELNYTGLLADDKASVVTDAENSTFYIVADSDDLNTVESSRSIKWGDDAYNASLGFTTNTQLVDENSTTSAEYSAVEMTAELSMNEYNVTNAENQSITGTTSAADGTDYNVLVESLDTEGDGFIEPENTATAENGELEAMVDFTDASVGDTFQVTLEGPGSEDDSAQGTVVEDAGGDETTTTTEDETTTTTEDETTTTTTEETTTEETTEETTMEGGDGDTGGDGEDGGSIPGFGVGIALVAILGAALLALRE